MQGKCVRAAWRIIDCSDTGEARLRIDVRSIEDCEFTEGLLYEPADGSNGMVIAGRDWSNIVVYVPDWLVEQYASNCVASALEEWLVRSVRSKIARRQAQVLDTGAK